MRLADLLLTVAIWTGVSDQGGSSSLQSRGVLINAYYDYPSVGLKPISASGTVYLTKLNVGLGKS